LIMLDSTKSEQDQKDLIIHRCAEDIRGFAVLFFPHYCTRKFNVFHEDSFQNYKWAEKDVRRVRAAPRGAAKSTLACLIKPIHDVCYDLEKFIVVISATTALANKKLKNVRQEIQFNPFLADVYGTFFPIKKPGAQEFEAHSDISSTYFVALGKGSAVRGISIGQYRPTKLVCDDVEDAREVLNEMLRQKDNDWFFEDVLKAGDTGTNVDFVGTVLHPESLLKKLLQNPRYDVMPVYQSIMEWSQHEDLWEKWREIYRDIDLKDRAGKANAFYKENEEKMVGGTVVMWPEKESYLDLMIEMEEIGRRAFMKEKQNDPVGANDTIFENFHWYREEQDGLRIESNGALIPWKNLLSVGAIDPATGQNGSKVRKGKLPDYTCIPLGYKDLKKRLFVHHDFTKRVSPSKAIEEIFNLYDKYEFEKFAVETNLFRNLLLPNIRDEQKRREKKTGSSFKISFYDVVQTENKHERIYRMEPKVNHGWILFNRALSAPFKNMFRDFPFADHDDAPDAVEILWNLIHNRYKPSAMNVNVMNR